MVVSFVKADIRGIKVQPVSKIQGIALFSVVALVLFALVWGGINWAKGRSDHYATQSSGASQQPQESPQPTPQEQQKEPAKDQPQPAPSQPPQSSPETVSKPTEQKPEVAGAQTQQTPAPAPVVPSTGPEDIFLAVLAITVTGFAAAKYFQQRHRLVSYR